MLSGLVSVGCWGNTGNFFKCTGEVGHIKKTASLGNLPNIFIGL